MFSTEVQYALRGLSELACRPSDKAVRLDELVHGTQMPREFVAKVFQKLVKAMLIHSSRGRGGGFALARDAGAITLMQIVEAIDGPRPFDRCVVGLVECNDLMPCPQHDLYKPIRQALQQYLNQTTLADLAVSLRAKLAWQRLRFQSPLANSAPIADVPSDAVASAPDRPTEPAGN